MRCLCLTMVAFLVAGCGDSGEDEGSQQVSSAADPFDDNTVATYEFTIAPSDWDAMVANPDDNTWRRATLVWQGETYSDVAVHPSGQNSRVPGNPKPSLHLSFEEFVPSRHFHHLPSLKLDCQIDDPAMMRERLTYGVHRAFGLAAPREVHARVVVNGVYKGLYAAEERITKSFVKGRFGPDVNQLYKFTGIDDDVHWHGSDPALYVPLRYEPHVDSLPSDAAGLRDLINALNNLPYDSAAAVFDVDTFVKEIAIEVITGETDGYLGGGDANDPTTWSNNFYLYKVPATGRYTLLGWDRNEDYWRMPETSPITDTFDKRILTRRLISERPENLAKLKAALQALLDGPHGTALMQARVDFVTAQIRDLAAQEPFNPKRPRTFQQWQWEVGDLRGYIQRRNDGVRAQLP
jgi:spore coat protein CotH